MSRRKTINVPIYIDTNSDACASGGDLPDGIFYEIAGGMSVESAVLEMTAALMEVSINESRGYFSEYLYGAIMEMMCAIRPGYVIDHENGQKDGPDKDVAKGLKLVS